MWENIVRTIFLSGLLMLINPVLAQDANSDWRKTGSSEEKINNVVKVIPSTADIMFLMGERYRNLYWAGKQGKWEFAQYQTEEMQSLIKELILTRPNRTVTAQVFLHNAFKEFETAITKKDWQEFQNAFANMREQCMICHRQNEHAFIVLNEKPRKGNSPALD